MSLPISSSNLKKPNPVLHSQEGFQKPSSNNFAGQTYSNAPVSQNLTQIDLTNQKRQTSYIITEEELAQQLKKQKLDQTPSEKFGNLADTLFSFYNNASSLKKPELPANPPSTNIYYKLVPVELPIEALNSQNTIISGSINSSQDAHTLFISPDKPMVNTHNRDKILQAVNLKDFPRSSETSSALADLVLDVRKLVNSKEGEALQNPELYSEMGRKKKKSHLHERLEVMMKNKNPNILDKLKKGPNPTNKPPKKANKQNEVLVHKKQLEDRFMEMLGKTQSLLEATQNVIMKVSGGIAKDKAVSKQDTNHPELDESQNKLNFVGPEQILSVKPLEVDTKNLQAPENKVLGENPIHPPENIIKDKTTTEQTGEIVVKTEPVEESKTPHVLIIPQPIHRNLNQEPTRSISDPIQSDQAKTTKIVNTRIGADYQAKIQSLGEEKEEKNLKVLWSPENTEEGRIVNYLTDLKKVIKGKTTTEENAIKLLQQFNFDGDKAIQEIKTNTKFYQSHLKTKTRCLRSYNPQYWGMGGSNVG